MGGGLWCCMEKTAFTVDDVSETSSNTRETQRSGSATVRPASVRPAQPRQPPCSAGFRGEPCEGERVRRHPHPGAVCVSETPSKNAVTSISLPLDANPCSQTAQPQGPDSAPQPLLPEPQGRPSGGRVLRHRRACSQGGGSSRTACLPRDRVEGSPSGRRAL